MTAQGVVQIASTTNTAETLGTAPGAAQIERTANITWTQRAAPVVKEAAEDTMTGSQIVGAAIKTENLRAGERNSIIEEVGQTGPEL